MSIATLRTNALGEFTIGPEAHRMKDYEDFLVGSFEQFKRKGLSADKIVELKESLSSSLFSASVPESKSLMPLRPVNLGEFSLQKRHPGCPKHGSPSHHVSHVWRCRYAAKGSSYRARDTVVRYWVRY